MLQNGVVVIEDTEKPSNTSSMWFDSIKFSNFHFILKFSFCCEDEGHFYDEALAVH